MRPTNRFSQSKGERGVTIVVVTFFMVALFAFAALSLDVGNVLREQRKAQVGTDAAALAAATRLASADNTAVITEAEVIAAANGVTAAEIAAGSTGGYPGQVQVGNWDTNRAVNARFLAGGTPRNAVRVPARRTVALNFGRVIGLGLMRPAVHSVAILPPAGMAPFGIESGLVGTMSSNGVYTLNRDNAGNWGKLNLGGALNNPNVWEEAFDYGYSGPLGREGTVDGQQVYYNDTDPGFAKLIDAWEFRRVNNPIVVMPVVWGTFPTGRSAEVIIYAYATVELLMQNGRSGNNWEGQIRFLGVSNTPDTTPSASRRTLVE
jgi:hypothetical protein